MKKILFIAIMIISIASLVSCGKKDAASTSGSTFTLQGSGS